MFQFTIFPATIGILILIAVIGLSVLFTFKQALEEIAGVTGKSIQFQQVTIGEYEAMLAEYGLPKEDIAFLTYLFTEVMDGRNDNLTDGVQRALGRKLTDFATYLYKTAKTSIWEQSMV